MIAVGDVVPHSPSGFVETRFRRCAPKSRRLGCAQLYAPTSLGARVTPLHALLIQTLLCSSRLAGHFLIHPIFIRACTEAIDRQSSWALFQWFYAGCPGVCEFAASWQIGSSDQQRFRTSKQNKTSGRQRDWLRCIGPHADGCGLGGGAIS